MRLHSFPTKIFKHMIRRHLMCHHLNKNLLKIKKINSTKQDIVGSLDSCIQHFLVCTTLFHNSTSTESQKVSHSQDTLCQPLNLRKCMFLSTDNTNMLTQWEFTIKMDEDRIYHIITMMKNLNRNKTRTNGKWKLPIDSSCQWTKIAISQTNFT